GSSGRTSGAAAAMFPLFGYAEHDLQGDSCLLWLEYFLPGCTQRAIRRGRRTDARDPDAKEIRPVFLVLPKCLARPDRIELAVQRNRIVIVDKPQRSADGERIEFGKDHGMAQRAGNLADIEILSAVRRHSAIFRSGDKCYQQDGILVSVQSVFFAWFQAHHLAWIQIASCVVFEERYVSLERMDRDLAGRGVLGNQVPSGHTDEHYAVARLVDHYLRIETRVELNELVQVMFLHLALTSEFRSPSCSNLGRATGLCYDLSRRGTRWTESPEEFRRCVRLACSARWMKRACDGSRLALRISTWRR